MLALAFGVGHNGMAMYDQDAVPPFAEHQILTTRNIDDDFLGITGWFVGGLQFQVEHHLFPTLPHGNFPQVRREVEQLCTKHGIPYHSVSLWRGTWEVLECLQDISRDLVRHFPAV